MSAVPYTVERRPDTGVNNVQLGIWLFLASEVMLFGGLFSAYFMLRAGAPEAWRPLSSHLWSALANTLLLAAATATLKTGTATVSGLRLRVAASGGFAIAFCVSKLSEYASFIGAGLGPAASTQMATYYLLTGVHVFHVLGGLVANLWIAWTAGDERSVVRNRVEATTLYWLFVDMVWLLIAVLLYVV